MLRTGHVEVDEQSLAVFVAMRCRKWYDPLCEGCILHLWLQS